VKPESSGCNELKYNLDADTIAAIFKTYPAGTTSDAAKLFCERCWIFFRLSFPKSYKDIRDPTPGSYPQLLFAMQSYKLHLLDNARRLVNLWLSKFLVLGRVENITWGFPLSGYPVIYTQ
jgi:hypothetical protein